MRTKPYPNEWPPERAAELIRRFNDGESFAHIASDMALTRMAIIGKCNRLGLRRDPPPSRDLSEKRSAAARAGNLTRKLRRPRQPPARPRSDPANDMRYQKLIAGPRYSDEPLPSQNESDLAIPRRRRKNIFTLGPRDCKFPIGRPGEAGFFFCGAKQVKGLPYCGVHAARCYTPARGA